MGTHLQVTIRSARPYTEREMARQRDHAFRSDVGIKWGRPVRGSRRALWMALCIVDDESQPHQARVRNGAIKRAGLAT